MKIGDVVRRPVNTSSTRDGCGDESKIKHPGKVIYIHPEGRFFVLEFRFPLGNIRESYFA